MTELDPNQKKERIALALAAVTFLLLVLGTIVLSVSIGVIFGMAWGFVIVGAAMILFGLVIGFSN